MWSDQESAELDELPPDSVATLQKPFFPATLLKTVAALIGPPAEFAPPLKVGGSDRTMVDSGRTSLDNPPGEFQFPQVRSIIAELHTGLRFGEVARSAYWKGDLVAAATNRENARHAYKTAKLLLRQIHGPTVPGGTWIDDAIAELDVVISRISDRR